MALVLVGADDVLGNGDVIVRQAAFVQGWRVAVALLSVAGAVTLEGAAVHVRVTAASPCAAARGHHHQLGRIPPAG